MKIIKLSATTSTNDYCKQLVSNDLVDDYLTVYAECQTHGKGQMGNSWLAEKGSSLTFSFIKHFQTIAMEDLFIWNALVSVSSVRAMRHLNLTNIYVKWPNDILAGNKKIGGILIENIIKSDKNCITINGIGINLKPIKNICLPHVSDIFSQYQTLIDPECLMHAILNEVIFSFKKMVENKEEIWDAYHNLLFGLNAYFEFENNDAHRFRAKIIGVSRYGKLMLETENKQISEYGVKEIKMYY